MSRNPMARFLADARNRRRIVPDKRREVDAAKQNEQIKEATDE